jgi:hypothetical protein
MKAIHEAAQARDTTELLRRYTEWLLQYGYCDSDVWSEEPNALQRYLVSHPPISTSIDTALKSAQDAHTEFVKLLHKIRGGEIVSPLDVQAQYANLVIVHGELQECVGDAFANRENTEADRKDRQADVFPNLRLSSKSAKEAEMQLPKLVRKELNIEIEREKEWKMLAARIDMIQTDIDFCRSANATLRSAESTPSHSHP